eukprot:6197550-Pleurochrysis_carterae.AAC.1
MSMPVTHEELRKPGLRVLQHIQLTADETLPPALLPEPPLKSDIRQPGENMSWQQPDRSRPLAPTEAASRTTLVALPRQP